MLPVRYHPSEYLFNSYITSTVPGLHFCRWQYIRSSANPRTVSPKARTPAHRMQSLDQILTQNGHLRSFKVIRFGVNEEPLRGYIVQYNNCGIECEGWEDIASERSKNCHLRPPHSHLTLSSKPPRISTQISPCCKLGSLGYNFVADSI